MHNLFRKFPAFVPLKFRWPFLHFPQEIFFWRIFENSYKSRGLKVSKEAQPEPKFQHTSRRQSGPLEKAGDVAGRKIEYETGILAIERLKIILDILIFTIKYKNREATMDYTIEALIEKIREFHPELAEKGMNLTVKPEGEDKYLIKLDKGGEEFGFYLEKKEADDCMAGKSCVNLAVMVTECVVELEDRLV